MITNSEWFKSDAIYCADARDIASRIKPNSVDLSVWSPPYHVGKDYEKDMSFVEWKNLLRKVIAGHFVVLKVGAFLAINIADILCFKDPTMPRIMAENISHRKRQEISRDLVLNTWAKYPDLKRGEIASMLGCSEQTVDRRVKGNNIRGGKYQTQTRVKLVGGLLEEWALEAGLFLYDRRIWVKDAAWENSKWHTMSYRAVDEFEYVYIFWKPGSTIVDKSRLTQNEWITWGSRGVWSIPSVRTNQDHESKYPLELPRRLIQLFTQPGDLVLDCFVGSGTTGAAAAMEDRHFIGLDLALRSVQMASRLFSNIIRDKRANKHELFVVQQTKKIRSKAGVAAKFLRG